MTDLVSRLLEAIGEVERLAKFEDEDFRTHRDSWHTRACGYGQGELLEECDCPVPSSVLRRCSADRKLVDLHGIVHRDIGWLEWDEGEHAEMYAELPVCGLCVPKHSSFPRREDVPEGPCRTVRILVEGYGLSDYREGGDRG